jgi:hypothetical protein
LIDELNIKYLRDDGFSKKTFLKKKLLKAQYDLKKKLLINNSLEQKELFFYVQSIID